MKNPAVLFYTSDFLTGTMFMTDDQVGKYIRLLCAQHVKGHLKETDMFNICKTYDEDVFLKFKVDSDGLYYNERMDDEVSKRQNYCEGRRKNRLNTDKQQIKQKDDENICQTHDETYVKHMGNGNGNGNGDINVRHDIFIDKNIYKNNNICHEKIPGGETSLVQASPSHEVTGQGEEPVFKEKKKAPVRERNAAAYADEVRVDNLDPSFSAYKKLVGYILGANPSGEPYWNVLSINKQFTFNQFMRVVSRAKGSDIESMNTIIGYIDSIENNKSYAKKYDSLPSTVTNWMNRAGMLKPIVTQKVS